jgi:hypothetical protein
VREGSPPLHVAAYSNELLDYVKANRRSFAKARTQESPLCDIASSRSDEKINKAEAKFTADWNGELWLRYPVHYCKRVGTTSPCCRSRAESVSKMQKSLKLYGLARLPETPSPSKWTKLGPCLDFGMLGRCCANFLAPSFAKGFETLKFHQYVESNSGEWQDVKLVQDLELSAVQGKRCQHTLVFLNSVECSFRMRTLSLATESLRMLTVFFIECSQDARSLLRQPPLLDLLHGPASPLTAVSQYISHLLLSDDSDGRLLLLWKPEGFPTLQAWCAGACFATEQIALPC